MKKILALLIPFLFVACSNDSEEPITYNLNVKEIVDMIDKTPSQVKQSFTGNFVKETPTMTGKEMVYSLPTGSGTYNIVFMFNAEDQMFDAEARTIVSGSSLIPVNYFKTEMNKVAQTWPGTPYYGIYESPTSSVRFDDRSEFWEYVSTHPVSHYINEVWTLQEGQQAGSITLKGSYSKIANVVTIRIIKEVL